jgi:multidrug resistance efflux pump
MEVRSADMRRLAGLLAGLLAALSAPGCRDAGAVGPTALVVRRGDYIERMLLTGEMLAVRIETLSVPEIPSWQTTLRWVVMDGSSVKQGEKVAELDSTEFSSDTEELRLEVLKGRNELDRTVADLAARAADKEAELARRATALEKARAAAAIPDSVLPRRERQERDLARIRAETGYEKARADLDAERRAAVAERDVALLRLEKAERELKQYEDGLRSLVVSAPRDGLIQIAKHWEGRKLQVGDSVFVGMTLATLPDLSEMAVEAQLLDVDDGRVRTGMPVFAVLDAWPAERFPGRVVELTPIAKEPEAQSLRRAFRVRILLERVDSSRVRPGMSVRAEVETRNLKGVLLAPRAALVLGGAEARARLAAGGDRPVRLGPCNASECVVEDGLEECTRLAAGEPAT